MVLPIDFEHKTSLLLGDNEYNNFRNALVDEVPVSIRTNPFKHRDLIKSLFTHTASPVPWSGSGFYLNHRPTFTFDPLFHAGCYYVQEASSMFLGQVIEQFIKEPVRMLDLCAAPGGKSTHIRSLLPAGSLLVSNEIVRSRSHVLAENLTKWGHPDVVVTNNEPSDFRKSILFDAVLADVPCSGEGMFRKDPEAIKEWSPENVINCRQRQREIINDIWPAIRPGGLLIYSTCTYNLSENEENIAWIQQSLGGMPQHVEISLDWNITTRFAGYDFPVYRFFPHKTKGEGFFLAVIRKPGDSEYTENNNLPEKHKLKKINRNKPAQTISLPEHIKSWITDSGDYTLHTEGERFYAFTKFYENELHSFKHNLRIVLAGVPVGMRKGKDVKPDHALAMSKLFNRNIFPEVELAWEQAIGYLRKESVILPPETPKGIVLVTYKNIPLGFVNQVGNRANNLYPQEWRIRTGHIPDKSPF